MIYFIQAGGDIGPVKIGTCGNAVRSRVMELQSGNHLKLTVMREIPGTERHEKWLHKIYHAKRIRGEWFNFCPSMKDIAVPKKLPAPAAAIRLPKKHADNALARWLAKEERSASWFARKIRRSPATVTRWISGDRHPGGQSIYDIEAATGGHVTRRDFPRSNGNA